MVELQRAGLGDFRYPMYIPCSRGPCPNYVHWCASSPYCAPECKAQAKREEWNATRRARRAQAAEERDPISCGWCTELFRPARSDAKYCGVRCRVAAHRDQGEQSPERADAEPVDWDEVPGPLYRDPLDLSTFHEEWIGRELQRALTPDDVRKAVADLRGQGGVISDADELRLVAGVELPR